MNKHLIVATYDGIGTHYSGVGTIAKNLVRSLIASTDANKFKVSIAYIDVDKLSKVFNEESFNEWNFADVSLVTALNLLLDPNERNYIILNDTPFLFFAKYKELVHDKSL